jgi:hypothetical protein
MTLESANALAFMLFAVFGPANLPQAALPREPIAHVQELTGMVRRVDYAERTVQLVSGARPVRMTFIGVKDTTRLLGLNGAGVRLDGFVVGDTVHAVLERPTRVPIAARSLELVTRRRE